jgi:YegS/Rv2252/BmrU family lipid kinase
VTEAAAAIGGNRRPVVIFNPAAGRSAGRERRRIENALAKGGLDHEWVETTKDDPGQGITSRSIAEGATLILACGGDGTMAACATALAGTQVPLAVLPSGTGNLLAINFKIPLDIDDAVRVAIDGKRRRIDVGSVDGKCFAVMAGMGFDAALLKDTDAALKRRIKALAYVPAGVKHLRSAPTHLSIRFDDRPPVEGPAHIVLIGNLGRIQGGLEVLPAAQPDDGLLDVAVVKAGSIRTWAAVLLRVLRKDGRDDARVQTYRARRVSIRARDPLPFELDGDVCGEARQLDVSIRPNALTICVPSDEVSHSGSTSRIFKRRPR